MPFNNIPFPFETSSPQRGAKPGGFGFNTWVEPATGLVGPRPLWKEIGPRFATAVGQSKPAFILPFQPVYASSDPALNTAPVIGELVTAYTQGAAGLRPRSFTYSTTNGSPFALTAISAGADVAITTVTDRLKMYQRHVLAPDGVSAWAVIAKTSNPRTDSVVYVTNGAYNANSVVTVTLVPGLPDCTIQGLAFAGGRVFALAIEQSTGRPIIHASAVGGATFTGGYPLLLSLQPDSASIFTGGSGIISLDNRRLLVYSESTVLIYSLAPASLTLENSLQGIGTFAEGGCVMVGDRALMLCSAGPVWVSLEVLKDSYRPAMFGGGAGEIAQEWYSKVLLEPGRSTAGAWRSPGQRLTSYYSSQWNCVFFSSESINETLYLYLGDDNHPPYASVWDTSWVKAWELKRKTNNDTNLTVSRNYRPMFMARDYNGDGTEVQVVGLLTTEFYNAQSGAANADLAPFVEQEAQTTWYMMTPPLDLGDKDNPFPYASIRQSSLNILASSRKAGTTPISTAIRAYWISQRNGNTGFSPAGNAASLPLVPLISQLDLSKARQQPPTLQVPLLENALIAFSKVRLPYSSTNGARPRMVVYGTLGGHDIIHVGSIDVTWQPIKSNAASF